jgi:hypothetical protein
MDKKEKDEWSEELNDYFKNMYYYGIIPIEAFWFTFSLSLLVCYIPFKIFLICSKED